MIRAWKRFAAYALISLVILVGMDMARAGDAPTGAHAETRQALALGERARR
ncbi:hypothetical protein [Halomonas elongata]|uniref:hypothetical protein n=1 Tax=Halomonas elongata TaxID=2746 RepID=UPI0023AFF76F|nr:hypothetical protein [Halomonas elongata]